MERPIDYFFAGAASLAEQLDSERRPRGVGCIAPRGAVCGPPWPWPLRARQPRRTKTRRGCRLPLRTFAEPMLAVLRDGRHILGTLISYDHFGERGSCAASAAAAGGGGGRRVAALAGLAWSSTCTAPPHRARHTRTARSRATRVAHASVCHATPPCAGSLVLKNAHERHVAGGLFCDLPMGGVYMVRGENLALLGEVVSGRAGGSRRSRSAAAAVVGGLSLRWGPTPPPPPPSLAADRQPRIIVCATPKPRTRACRTQPGTSPTPCSDAPRGRRSGKPRWTSRRRGPRPRHRQPERPRIRGRRGPWTRARLS